MKYFCLEAHHLDLIVPAALVTVGDNQGVTEAMDKAIPHIASWHKGSNVIRKKQSYREVVDIVDKGITPLKKRYVITETPLMLLE